MTIGWLKAWYEKHVLSQNNRAMFNAWLMYAGFIWTAVELAQFLLIAWDNNNVETAVSRGYGLIEVNWESAYQGKWYKRADNILWDKAPILNEPSSIYGVGQFMAN